MNLKNNTNASKCIELFEIRVEINLLPIYLLTLSFKNSDLTTWPIKKVESIGPFGRSFYYVALLIHSDSSMRNSNFPHNTYIHICHYICTVRVTKLIWTIATRSTCVAERRRWLRRLQLWNNKKFAIVAKRKKVDGECAERDGDCVCHGKTNIKLRNLSESSHCLALFGLHKGEKFARNCDCFSSHIRASPPSPAHFQCSSSPSIFIPQQRSMLLFFFFWRMT